MKTLFRTQLQIDGVASTYEVVFVDDAYRFQPSEGQGPEIRIRREQDEWHPLTQQADGLFQQCTGLLEQYLLSQH